MGVRIQEYPGMLHVSIAPLLFECSETHVGGAENMEIEKLCTIHRRRVRGCRYDTLQVRCTPSLTLSRDDTNNYVCETFRHVPSDAPLC